MASSPPSPIPAGPGREPLAYHIAGLDCAEEVAVLRRELGPLVADDDDLQFDLLNGILRVRGLDDASVRSAVARTGMHADPLRSGPARPARDARRLAPTALSALGTILAFASQGLDHGTWRALLAPGDAIGGYPLAPLTVALAAAATLAGTWLVLPKAWSAVRQRRADMNLLMVLAVLGAGLIGEWLEAATVSCLFALSLSLEAWSIGRARRAVEALLDLAPSTVRVLLPGGGERSLDAADVAVGARFVVRPGERVPLDGTVAAGEGAVDQSPITGESRPVAKAPGDPVYAGTVNGEGALEITSTRPAGETILAHIIRLVGSSQARRARAEQWVERFARIYTPVILALAMALALLPPLLLGGDWSTWTYRALVLLIIGCPCALVISTPVAVVAGLACAARHGVLIKGGAFLELPARIAAFAFDKTGTLTIGRPVVRRVVPLAGHGEDELLAIAAALEQRSTHPLAQAIVAHAAARGVTPAAAEAVTMVPGRGVTGIVAGRAHWLGSFRYLLERGQEDEALREQLRALQQDGDTVVAFGEERHVCGLIALADAVRPEARAALDELRGLGIASIAMLTGDDPGTARSIAAAAGVDQVHAGLLPEDKQRVVAGLIAQHGRVAMVGDGVNDAPAMASATLGIAMGAGGSDAAIETADLALMSDDLSRLPWVVRHSRRTLAVIRQNTVLALGIKLGVLALSVAGHASLWAAITADMGASLLVIANALRLLRGASGTRQARHAYARPA